MSQLESNCPVPEVLLNYLLGQLASDEASKWDDHVLQCSSCSTLAMKWDAEGNLRPIHDTLADINDTAIVEQLREAMKGFISQRPNWQSDTSDKGGADSGPTMVPNIPGYKIETEIGRGGMGVVYRAQQMGLNGGVPLRTVALKVLLSGSHSSPTEIERFRSEAETIARLHHPNIVQIHTVGEHEGLSFLALEYCEGGSLDHSIRATPQPPLEAARLVRTLCDAIHAAHQCGIIHRDLKPANILLTASGQPKITDFGLAKCFDSAGFETMSGTIMGSPSYMAPEQARGRAKHVSPSVDIYSLGAILYELLTGRPPFKSASRVETLLQVVQQEVVPPQKLNRNIPEDLNSICLKCLEKDSTNRYSSALALGEELDRYLRGESTLVRPLGRARRSWRWCRRNPLVATLLASAILLLVTVTIVVTLAFFYEKRARNRAEELAYAAQIALAELEWKQGSTEIAKQMLQRTPVARRGWEYRYLSALFHRGQTSMGQLGIVTSVAFSPDGTLVAAAGNDDTSRMGLDEKAIEEFEQSVVKVWNSRNGKEVLSLRGHLDSVTSIAFSPDGTQIVSGSVDKTLKLWDVRTGKETRTFSGHSEAVTSVAFSPDSTRIASASNDKTVRLWDARNGISVRTLQTENFSEVVLFSSDGKKVVCADGNSVRIWDVSDGHEVSRFRSEANGIRSIAFSPDGKRIATAGEERTIRVLDSSSGREILKIRGDGNRINSVVFSPDGTRLFSGGNDNLLRIWDANSGEELLALQGHCSEIVALSVCRDGKRIVASAASERIGGSVIVWDLEAEYQPRILKGLQHEFHHMAFSADGQRIFAGTIPGSTGNMKMWDVNRGLEIPSPFEKLEKHGHSSLIAIHDAGNRIMKVVHGSYFEVRDLNSMEVLTLEGPFPGVSCGAFSPDGNWIVLCGRFQTVQLWDARNGRVARTLQTDSNAFDRDRFESIRSIRFSPDGKRITALDSKFVTVWDAKSGSELSKEKRLNDRSFHSTADSPNGKMRALGLSDGTIVLVDTQTGQDVWKTESFFGPVCSISFSPDGTRIVSANSEKSARLWNAATGELTMTLRSHFSPVKQVAFSPNGNQIATGCSDGTIRIWDATSN